MDTTQTTNPGANMTVTIRNRPVTVSSFADASAKIRKAFGRTSGSGYSRGGHGAIHFNGAIIARVSYNGRVWCATCEGEIDGEAGATFAAKPCACGNTDHGRALSA